MEQFAVLGYPIDHSFSPVMHEASFRAIGYDAVYTKRSVKPEALPEALAMLREEGFRGVNITIPLKQAILPLLNHVTPEATRLGAVNTVRFEEDGTMSGTNTDAPGFISAVQQELGLTPAGLCVAVVGCGGAGRAIALALSTRGIRKLILVDAFTPESAQAVQHECATYMPSLTCEIASVKAVHEADLIVQCTPSGLSVCPKPALDRTHFSAHQALFDIVIAPNHPDTATMTEAHAVGMPCCNGVAMLVAQGALSFNYWTGMTADLSAMRRAVDDALFTRR